MRRKTSLRGLSEVGLERVLAAQLDDEAWFERLRQVARARAAGSASGLGALGEYELLAEVGRGGQGVVYRARQPRTGRDVALKRLRAGLFASPESHARFRREIEAVSALSHPGIVALYGCEEIDGQQVAVLQWVDGRHFDAWARSPGPDGELPAVRRVVEVFLQVCDAVQHAHQRGILHRDIKPSNILVDGDGRALVLDFGLAKSHSAQDQATVTHSGMFVGTLAYAAPEQALGRTHEVDLRTDVYALGATLYHALSGRAPLDTDGELPAVLERLSYATPASASRHDPRVPRELDLVLGKALAKASDERYGSAALLADDLRRHLEGLPVAAHAPSLRYRLGRLVRRNKLAFAGAALFLVVLLVATLVSVSLWFDARRERERAEDALEREQQRTAALIKASELHEKQLTRANVADQLLERLIEHSSRALVDGRPTVTLREALGQVSSEFSEHSDASASAGMSPASRAWMHMFLGNALSRADAPVQALRHFQSASELRAELTLGEPTLETSEALEKAGRAARVAGELELAEEFLTAAWQERTRLLGDGDGYLAVTTNSLALLKRAQRRLDESEALLVAALRMYQNIYGPTDPRLCIVYRNLGVLYNDWGRHTEAVELLSLAVRGFEESNDIERDYLGCLGDLADALAATGESEAALQMARRGSEGLERLYGVGHPLMRRASGVLAKVLAKGGVRDEAEPMLGALVEEAAASNDVAALLGLMRTRVEMLEGSGRSDAALEVAREALCVAQAAYRPLHPVIGVGSLDVGRLALKLGRVDEAGRVLDLARNCYFGRFAPREQAQIERLAAGLAAVQER